MDKQEFLIVKREVKKDIDKLFQYLKDLEEEYILCNRKFEYGEKVKIQSNKGVDYAFVTNCKIHEDGTLYYGLRKVKKDGSMSNQKFVRYNLDSYDIIKLNQ